MSTATSGQFLTVPPLSHRSTQHHRRDSARAAAQSPRMHHPATRNVASSSRLKLEDTPLGIPVSPSPRAAPSADGAHARRASVSTKPPSSSRTPAAARRRQTRPSPLVPQPQPPSNILLPATAANPNPNPNPSDARSTRSPQQQPQPQPQPPAQLSPRSIFRAMPFLLRLRSPPSDLLNITCTSGEPRTHSVLNRAPISKAPQAVTYNQTLVCEDGVNAEVLLRLARNELFERAQQTDRRVTALVDEEYVFPSSLLS